MANKELVGISHLASTTVGRLYGGSAAASATEQSITARQRDEGIQHATVLKCKLPLGWCLEDPAAPSTAHFGNRTNALLSALILQGKPPWRCSRCFSSSFSSGRLYHTVVRRTLHPSLDAVKSRGRRDGSSGGFRIAARVLEERR